MATAAISPASTGSFCDSSDKTYGVPRTSLPVTIKPAQVKEGRLRTREAFNVEGLWGDITAAVSSAGATRSRLRTCSYEFQKSKLWSKE